jgi:arabinosyltransferase C
MNQVPEPLESPEFRSREVGRWALILGTILTLLASLPLLTGLSQAGGGMYLQQQVALDDQMVYAAWMQQAASGSFLFRNLFAIDPQPGLTIHLYFWVLGLISAFAGVVWTLTLARLAFSFLFVWMLGKLLLKLEFSVLQAKLGMVLASLAGGLGFLAWEPFGRMILGGSPVSPLTNGRLPIDVWQPEAFVFPSMLTNGLFMASLCLFLVILGAVVDARESWKPVPWGFGAFLLLMNIHSYDVLLLTLVLVGFLVALLGSGSATGPWAGRVVVMGLGALPPAAWFIYVLQQDKVFQNRAATLTFSPTLAQVIVGVFPVLAAAMVGLWLNKKEDHDNRLGAGLVTGLLGLALVLSMGHNPDTYFANANGFGFIFAACLAALFLLKESSIPRALLWSWAIVGVAALTFPGLFQRKLAMGLVIPWALLAASYAADWLLPLPGSRRMIYGGVGCLLACASSLLWLQRETLLVRDNVSITTTHAPILDADAAAVLAEVKKLPAGAVLIAMPGVPLPNQGSPGRFLTPYLPDLNPMIPGLAGKVAFAGHWSETPDYDRRRGQASSFFLAKTSPDERRAIIEAAGAAYALAPQPSAFDQLPLASPQVLGTQVVKETPRWALVRLSER